MYLYKIDLLFATGRGEETELGNKYMQERHIYFFLFLTQYQKVAELFPATPCLENSYL